MRDRSGIIGFSAQRRTYRDQVLHRAGGPAIFPHHSGDRMVIKARMRTRKVHFMRPSLLESQFATPEPPGPCEEAVTLDIDPPHGPQVDAPVAL